MALSRAGSGLIKSWDGGGLSRAKWGGVGVGLTRVYKKSKGVTKGFTTFFIFLNVLLLFIFIYLFYFFFFGGGGGGGDGDQGYGRR